MRNNNKSHSKGKGKPNYRGGRNKEFVSGKETKYNGGESPQANDWQFYAASEEIARDVASIPFNYLGGTAFKLKAKDSYDVNYVRSHAIPSVFNVNYVNSIGITDSRTQGVNMAAVQLYTFIRHSNSGAKNYEAADVMMYILAMRDLYAEFFQAKKILGCAGLYNYYNHNLPDILIQAHNINPEDLRSNLAQYRGRLNLIAKKINSFAVPKYFKIFDRSAYINSFIFGDSTSVRGQFYNFVKAGYYKWNGTLSENGTALEFKLSNTSKDDSVMNTDMANYSYLLDVLEEQLDALFLDEDAITMSGDILKAFNESDLYTIAQTDENYMVSIVKDEDILAQIENSHCAMPYGLSIHDSSIECKFNVTQADQVITFQPTMKSEKFANRYNYLMPQNLIINSHKDRPDYKDVLEWTRLITVSDITNDDFEGTVNFTSTGLELVLDYSILTTRYGAGFGPTRIKIGYSVNAQDTNNASILGNMQVFDWHPFLYGLDSIIGNLPAVWGDIKIATLADNVTLDKINDAAVYGALYGSMYNKQ